MPQNEQPVNQAENVRRAILSEMSQDSSLKKRQNSALAARQRVCDLKPERPVKRLELVVLRKYPRRIVMSGRYDGPIAAACARDESGIVGLVLWGDQVDKVRCGDLIRIEHGWCRQRDGELVVSTGRTGRLSLIER